MNLFRLYNELKKDERFREREKLISRLRDKTEFGAEDIGAIFAYKKLDCHSTTEIEKITRKAFASNDLVEKFRILKRMAGVTTTMASTILTFQNPNRYAELDPKTWRILRESFGFNAPEKDAHSDYTAPEYLGYLGILDSIGAEYGMKLSDVEFVLKTVD